MGLPEDDVLAELSAGRVQLRYDVLSDVGTGRLVGVQADLVWEHPTRGLLPAAEVWAAAGRAGQHRGLRRGALARSLADVAGFSDTATLGILLPGALTHLDTFASDVLAVLADSGVPAGRLALSFPEDLLASDALPALTALRAAGVRLAVNDYGLRTTLWGLLTHVQLDAVIVSLHTLASTGGLDRALRVLGGISAAAAEAEVRTIVADVEGTEVLARVGELGLLAMTGPLLPTARTAGQVAALLAP